MALLTQGIPPKPYGEGGRKVFLPLSSTQQLYQGQMLSLLSGNLVPTTTAGAGNAIGICENDVLLGDTRASVWTDKIFIFANGTNALSDSTPYGTIVYAEDDHTVGSGGIGGSGEGAAGLFMGFEDDGTVRVFMWVGINLGGSVRASASLTNTSTQTITSVGRSVTYLQPALSQGSTVTLSTTGAVVGDIIKIVRTDTSAYTIAVVNGGAGAGTIATLPVSVIGFVEAVFDGTNWLFNGIGIS